MKVKLKQISDDLTKRKALFITAVISLIFIFLTTYYLLSFKEVALAIDGKEIRIVTRASTVADLLNSKKISFTPHDEISPDPESPLFPGTRVKIRYAKPVSVEINGKREFLMTLADDVNGALKEMGIDPMSDVRVSPLGINKLVSGMNINVAVLNRSREMVEIPIDYEKRREDDPGLLKGKTKVASRGEPGIKRQVVEHVTVDGKVIESNIVGEEIVKQPVAEVTKVGTKIPQLAAAPAPSAPGAPAGDVSRGSGRTLTMSSSAYAANTGGAGSRTATGTGVYRGIVAVDPRVIPLGTRLYIEGYGPAVAADTGGAIKGNRIDLGFGSAAEAIAWGRRTVTVHILN